MGPIRIHVWQMYNDQNPWNWGVSDERSTFHIMSSGRNIKTAKEAKGGGLKAFYWYFVMKFLKKSDRSNVVLGDFESRIYWE